MKRCFFLLLLLTAWAPEAQAESGTLVSEIVETFHNNVAAYEQVMLKYARILFYWCAVLEIAWLGVKAALGASDMRETIKNFCLVLMAAGFFLAVINNYHAWSWSIINGLKSVAGEATTLYDASDKPFTVGLDLAKILLTKTSFFNPVDSLTYVLAGFAILLCFALITLQIILIKCECIVALCASSILLGLGATSFFRDYAVNAIRYVVAVAFKLMTMQLLLGVGIGFISRLQIAENNWLQIGVTISFCLIFYSLVRILPETVASIIQGSHTGSGGALSFTMQAAGVGAIALAAGAYAGARNVGLAHQAARTEMATNNQSGFWTGAGLTARNLWNASAESRANAAERQSTISSALRQQIARRQMENVAAQGN